ncbi:MAG: hypothetical protein C0606_16860 [Hyphomicrobiales bacterium]|nr:MAG: hypothetical protein C0606_16860 [Hyphomicrobiales bacterium]
MSPRRVIVGLSGASGAALGVRIVELLGGVEGIETHLIVTDAAKRTLALELDDGAADRLFGLADQVHAIDDIAAAPASGSFRSSAMIVAPCSIRALSAIATGLADDLLVRAADVHLKERRRLVLMARETPLHLGHLRAMTAVTEMGAIIMPPVPAFYRRPDSIAALVDDLARRAIGLALPDIDTGLAEWAGG